MSKKSQQNHGKHQPRRATKRKLIHNVAVIHKAKQPRIPDHSTKPKETAQEDSWPEQQQGDVPRSMLY